jgi:hypothetical protein
MKSGGFYMICLKARDRFAPIFSQTLVLNIEATQKDLKSSIKFLNFIKTLQIKAKV